VADSRLTRTSYIPNQPPTKKRTPHYTETLYKEAPSIHNDDAKSDPRGENV